jgi:RNA polymerase sigma-70 factor (ECF subfamily)
MTGGNSAARTPDPPGQTNFGFRPSADPLLPFPEIYRAYFDFVWSSVRRLGVGEDAIDDVVQEVFVIIHSRLHTLQQPESLRSWIYGVVRRTVSGYHRSRKAAGGKGLDVEIVDETLRSTEPTPFERVERNDQVQLLARLLGEIGEAKREVFVLAEIEEMTVPEIAQALEIPLNTAYSRLRTARQEFEQALARHEASEKGGKQS